MPPQAKQSAPNVLQSAASEGEKTHRSVDLLGRVYDWSGVRKAAAGSPKGERGGVHQFYSSSCVVRRLVEPVPIRKDLAPYTALRDSAIPQSEATQQVVSAAKDNGRIYGPACGSGGMFVQSEQFDKSHDRDCNVIQLTSAA